MTLLTLEAGGSVTTLEEELVPVLARSLSGRPAPTPASGRRGTVV
jgi:hypothetical protein